MSNCACSGCSTLGITAAVGCMRQVHVLLVHSVLSLCSGTRPILPDPAHICMTRRVPVPIPRDWVRLLPGPGLGSPEIPKGYRLPITSTSALVLPSHIVLVVVLLVA